MEKRKLTYCISAPSLLFTLTALLGYAVFLVMLISFVSLIISAYKIRRAKTSATAKKLWLSLAFFLSSFMFLFSHLSLMRSYGFEDYLYLLDYVFALAVLIFVFSFMKYWMRLSIKTGSLIFVGALFVLFTILYGYKSIFQQASFLSPTGLSNDSSPTFNNPLGGGCGEMELF